MGVPKTLTEKQMKFAQELVANEEERLAHNVLSMQVIQKKHQDNRLAYYRIQNYIHL